MIDLPPPDPAVEIVVASRGISKGLAQTEGPQLVARSYVQFGRLQVGGQWKNVTSPVAGGEAAAFAGLTHDLGVFRLGVGANYKFQTNVSGPTDSDAWELTGSINARFGRIGARLSLVYSPDDLGSTGQSAYVEGGPTFDLDSATRLSANIGRRERSNSDDYTSFNAGIARTFSPNLSVDLRYFDTAQSGLGEAYRSRLVLSARLRL